MSNINSAEIPNNTNGTGNKKWDCSKFCVST